MKILTISTYQYDELSQKAKECAREWYREGGLDYDWWDSTYEDAKQIMELMGIDCDEIYFSGFSSQGSGACFEGSFDPAKVRLKGIKEYAPKDKELYRICKEFHDVSREFPDLSFSIGQSGHYYHKHSVNFDFSYGEMDSSVDTSEAEERLKEASRDLMEWIYRTLEKEYEYLQSDENIVDSIRANEYEFTKDGNRLATLN